MKWDWPMLCQDRSDNLIWPTDEQSIFETETRRRAHANDWNSPFVWKIHLWGDTVWYTIWWGFLATADDVDITRERNRPVAIGITTNRTLWLMGERRCMTAMAFDTNLMTVFLTVASQLFVVRNAGSSETFTRSQSATSAACRLPLCDIRVWHILRVLKCGLLTWKENCK